MQIRRWLETVKGLFAGREDSELEQSSVRLLIAIIMVVYFGRSSENPAALADGVIVSYAFLAYSLLLFSVVAAFNRVSATRRVIGIVGDLTATTVCMILANESGAVLVGMYLWVSLANGFRYGHTYLYLATALAVLGFAAVLQFSPYWGGHLSLAAGILALLLVLPIYVSKLVKQLESARKRAEEANRIKSQFLANMSHELRTPLHGILGVADLLSETKLTQEQTEYVKVINDSARTLVSLVTDVLDMSKIEAGKLKAEHTAFDFHGLLNSTLRLLKPQADKKGLYLHQHVDPSFDAYLCGDPLHIRQVLTNLVSNAIKFTPAGGIDVYVDVVDQSASAAAIKVRVIDTGIGISPCFQAKIFDDFTQADESTTRKYGGTGLGTAISKRLVHLMGGEIGVSSTLGCGSEFWFQLELNKAARPDPLPSQAELRCKVLVACSEKGERRLTEWLVGWNMHATFTFSSAELLDALQQAAGRVQFYDVVLIHGEILTQDPRDLAQEIWQRFPTAPLNLIFCREPGSILPSEQALSEAGYACTLHTPHQKPLLFNALHAATSVESFPSDVTLLKTRRGESGRGGFRILVAEDNETNQMVIKKLLEKAGHSAEVVGNGEDALVALSQKRFDIAVFDMQMPVMGGIEAAKIYRFETPHDERIPIVVLTANATADAKAQCEDAGVSLYLSKPLEGKQFIESIDQLGQGSKNFEEKPQPVTREPIDMAENDEKQGLLNYRLLEDLSELCGKTFLPQLVDQFTRDTRVLLATMRTHLENASISEFVDVAHALKGSAGSIGALQMFHTCLTAEKANRSNAEALLGEIERAFNETRHALSDYLEGVTGSSRRNGQI